MSDSSDRLDPRIAARGSTQPPWDAVTILHRAFLLAVGLLLAACAATSADTPFVPGASDPRAASGRDVVLRIERFRTCADCGWYEMRLFDDATSMVIGKEAVRQYGAWGGFLGPDRPRGWVWETPLGPSLKALYSRVAELPANATRRGAPGDSAALGLQRIEIEIEYGGRRVSREVELGPHSEPSTTALIQDIERVFTGTARLSTVQPRAAFFSDPRAVIHAHVFLHPPPECERADYADELRADFYQDGRVQTEYLSWQARRSPGANEVQERSITLGAKSVELLRTQLLENAGVLANASVLPQRYQTSWAPYISSTSSPPAFSNRYQFSRLYVKGGPSTVHDFSFALVRMQEAEQQRPPESIWPTELRTQFTSVIRELRSHFPEPDKARIEQCKRALGRK